MTSGNDTTSPNGSQNFLPSLESRSANLYILPSLGQIGMKMLTLINRILFGFLNHISSLDTKLLQTQTPYLGSPSNRKDGPDADGSKHHTKYSFENQADSPKTVMKSHNTAHRRVAGWKRSKGDDVMPDPDAQET